MALGDDPRDPRTRKGYRDVDPDEMKSRYDAGEQGAGSTSIGDELEGEYRAGFDAGAKKQRSAGGERKALTLQRPGRPPSIAAPFAIELVLITVDEIRNNHRPPLPSRLLAAFAVFGVLGAASGDAATAANALGWGLVVSTLLASGGASGKGGAIGALGTLGDFMGGKYAPRGSSSSGPTAPHPAAAVPPGTLPPKGPQGPMTTGAGKGYHVPGGGNRS